MTVFTVDTGALQQNQLIDAMDSLSNCANPDSTWTQAVDLVAAQGADALTVGKIERNSSTLLWARSSMSQGWLDEYVTQEYYNCDPFLNMFSTPDNQISAYAGRLTDQDAALENEIALNQGLYDAGYSALHGTKFGNLADSTGRIVTLCFNQSKSQPSPHPDMNVLMGLSSLIATFIQAPKTHLDTGFMATGVTMISQRERDVLSLLATGLQTARISERLGIRETTVTKHFATARNKLGANTREHALFIAMQRGLIDL